MTDGATADAAAFHLTSTEVAFAVPIGVVLAAFVSFLALRWSTNKTINAQRETLVTTLAAERDRLDARLAVDRAIAADDRLFERRYSQYTRLLQASDDLIGTALQLVYWHIAETMSPLGNDYGDRDEFMDRYNVAFEAWTAIRSAVNPIGQDEVELAVELFNDASNEYLWALWHRFRADTKEADRNFFSKVTFPPGITTFPGDEMPMGVFAEPKSDSYLIAEMNASAKALRQTVRHHLRGDEPPRANP